MATLTQNHLSIADLYKRSDDGKSIASIIEVLNECNEVTKDIPWKECNMGTINRHTIRTGLPTVSWGALYEGVEQSKSDTQQVDDTTGFVESSCGIDERELELAPDKNAFRASESRPHIEAMAQECATGLFYHDPATNVRLPKGLDARFGSIATSGAGNQIIDAGGTGSDNTSIWMVYWGDNTVHGLYPKGTKAGLQQIDRGKQRVTDASGNPYYMHEEDFRWNMGFAVKDWRFVVRIANVDVSDLAAGSVDLYKFLRQGYYKNLGRKYPKIKDLKAPGKACMYANTDVLEALDGLATNAGSSDNFTRLRYGEIQGEEVKMYRNFIVRETDALVNTEARIV